MLFLAHLSLNIAMVRVRVCVRARVGVRFRVRVTGAVPGGTGPRSL